MGSLNFQYFSAISCGLGGVNQWLRHVFIGCETVESKRGDGQLTACEVLLFHHEDMGIPWEIAKLGVRQGMWGAVKKIDPALRTYQKQRASGAPLSQCARMAQINTKVSADYQRCLESSSDNSSEVEKHENPKGRHVPKLLVVGGAILLACSLDRGLLTKAVIFGVARRFARNGRRLWFRMIFAPFETCLLIHRCREVRNCPMEAMPLLKSIGSAILFPIVWATEQL
jgi:hypothetical protein